ncbi:hypothetical protein I8J29_16280 [Paenibacillus sp. MWE-103]|uniref:Uncharacterized protein n=1 Tax=Paenibacillus artemisiicola TaxID=1172618 RepID=A0ABS3WCA1_9BACL|nr:hypothetical protein [Paenibacillus artemisiicola]MBO7745766.1 hypothetical protein [Paenibacillus artemisiicola]
MRLSSKLLIEQLGTDYIDTKLKGFSYDHASHLVQMRYGDVVNNENDKMIFFRNCFSVSINTWLEGIKGKAPSNPGEMDFFLHGITIDDVEVSGVQLYKCSMKIPMMDCQITCVTIELNCTNGARYLNQLV